MVEEFYQVHQAEYFRRIFYGRRQFGMGINLSSMPARLNAGLTQFLAGFGVRHNRSGNNNRDSNQRNDNEDAHIGEKKDGRETAVDEEQPSGNRSSNQELGHPQQRQFESEVEKKELHQGEDWKSRYEDLQRRFQTIEQKLRQTEADKAALCHSEDWKSRYEDLQRRFQTIEQKLPQTEADKVALRHRLSELAGAKLLENNPNITDLSDQDRATKLAEKFSELYDNEWTNAYTSLTEDCQLSEEDAIAGLLSILEKIFIFCVNYSEENWAAFQAAIVSCVGQGDSEDIKTLEKRFIDMRKKHADDVLKDSLMQKLLQHLEEEGGSNQPLYAAICNSGYVRKCGSLCWKMVIQDPPLFIPFTCTPGDTFNKVLYKAYTRSGDSIEYVVWPSLCLTKGGAVLCKGVAQAQKKMEENYEETEDNIHIDLKESEVQMTENKLYVQDSRQKVAERASSDEEIKRSQTHVDDIGDSSHECDILDKSADEYDDLKKALNWSKGQRTEEPHMEGVDSEQSHTQSEFNRGNINDGRPNSPKGQNRADAHALAIHSECDTKLIHDFKGKDVDSKPESDSEENTTVGYDLQERSIEVKMPQAQNPVITSKTISDDAKHDEKSGEQFSFTNTQIQDVKKEEIEPNEKQDTKSISEDGMSKLECNSLATTANDPNERSKDKSATNKMDHASEAAGDDTNKITTDNGSTDDGHQVDWEVRGTEDTVADKSNLVDTLDKNIHMKEITSTDLQVEEQNVEVEAREKETGGLKRPMTQEPAKDAKRFRATEEKVTEDQVIVIDTVDEVTKLSKANAAKFNAESLTQDLRSDDRNEAKESSDGSDINVDHNNSIETLHLDPSVEEPAQGSERLRGELHGKKDINSCSVETAQGKTYRRGEDSEETLNIGGTSINKIVVKNNEDKISENRSASEDQGETNSVLEECSILKTAVNGTGTKQDQDAKPEKLHKEYNGPPTIPKDGSDDSVKISNQTENEKQQLVTDEAMSTSEIVVADCGKTLAAGASEDLKGEPVLEFARDNSAITTNIQNTNENEVGNENGCNMDTSASGDLGESNGSSKEWNVCKTAASVPGTKQDKNAECKEKNNEHKGRHMLSLNGSGDSVSLLNESKHEKTRLGGKEGSTPEIELEGYSKMQATGTDHDKQSESEEDRITLEYDAGINTVDINANQTDNQRTSKENPNSQVVNANSEDAVENDAVDFGFANQKLMSNKPEPKHFESFSGDGKVECDQEEDSILTDAKQQSMNTAVEQHVTDTEHQREKDDSNSDGSNGERVQFSKEEITQTKEAGTQEIS